MKIKKFCYAFFFFVLLSNVAKAEDFLDAIDTQVRFLIVKSDLSKKVDRDARNEFIRALPESRNSAGYKVFVTEKEDPYINKKGTFTIKVRVAHIVDSLIVTVLYKYDGYCYYNRDGNLDRCDSWIETEKSTDTSVIEFYLTKFIKK
jgi:hypothetical protein